MADAAPEADSGTGHRRAYAVALLLLALGGATLLVAYGMTWGSVEVPLVAGLDGSTASQSLTGRELFPAAGAAGWVCLAGIAGVVATRGWGRLLVAAAVLLAGLGGAAVAVAFGASPATFLESAAGATSAAGLRAPADPTGWWIVATAGGLVALGAAGWAVVRGWRWPVLGSQYDRSVPRERELSAWQAQDLGRDPTDDLVE